MKNSIAWYDNVVKEMTKKKRKEYVCEGMWTPSGHLHIGNSRSEIFTPYAVYRALIDKGFRARQNFIIDDFDAVRKIPQDLSIKKSDEEKYIGIPCALAPSPIKGYKSWSNFFTSEIKSAIDEFGVELNIISAYETYKKGRFNDLIKYSLNHSKEIVKVWNKVSGSEKSLDFIPVQILCEKCGKIYFTKTEKWDGKYIHYKCKCGNSGAVPPTNGRAKLHWRVHWVAHWILHNVAFESAGKDHFSKGGSVDVGRTMMKEVYKKEPPYQIPTEFILLKGGAKMAGSAGNVITMNDWLNVASPESFRFLNFSYKPSSAIEFSLSDNSFLLLMTRYERAERIYYGFEEAENKKVEAKIKRAYKLSTLGEPSKKLSFQLPYSFAILLSQIINPKDKALIDKLKETGHIKGEPTKADRERIIKKLERARYWVENCGPEEMKITFLESVPEEISTKLNKDAKIAFKEVAKGLEKKDSPDEIQQLIFETAKQNNLQPKDLFKMLYLVILGGERGPKAGSLILALGKERIIRRLLELV